ncbi:MAG: hypothetical protein HC860_03190 [Alkalinema sp. RU_4_3]|nr:hypothetical protein [Alkalinema sp. RU_4_3]
MAPLTSDTARDQPIVLTIGKLNLTDLRSVVTLREHPIREYGWTKPAAVTISTAEAQQANFIQSQLRNQPAHLLNEATIWARAIYPLLALAETDYIRAWSEIALNAQFPGFSIGGIADGVLGRSIAGRLEAPYFVVVEAKRGIEAVDPIPQLYGELLAAAYINSQLEQVEEQIVFGCYTIADNWTFVKAVLRAIDQPKPVLDLEFSREYSEKSEILQILQILKSITASSGTINTLA